MGTAAHAGSSIFTGALVGAVGQTVICYAVNASSTKTLTNVKVTYRNLGGGSAGSGTCAAVGPRETCPTEVDLLNTGALYCEVTSDQGAKQGRASHGKGGAAEPNV